MKKIITKKKYNFITYYAGGITLIELVVVFGVLLLLAGIGIVSFNNFRERAFQNNAIAAIREIANAVEMYSVEFKEYQPSGALIHSKLAIYTDVTRLTKAFLNTKGKDPIYNNLTLPLYIIRQDEALCVYGAVGGIKPGPNYDYWITYCVETDETKVWARQGNQPACYWELRGGWRACRVGL